MGGVGSRLLFSGEGFPQLGKNQTGLARIARRYGSRSSSQSLGRTQPGESSLRRTALYSLTLTGPKTRPGLSVTIPFARSEAQSDETS